MFALIQNNKVIQVQDKKFPVHPSLKWIECDEAVKTGFTYENEVFTAPPVIETPIPEPTISLQEQIEALIDKLDGNEEKYLALKEYLATKKSS